jgi:hypothetical protein
MEITANRHQVKEMKMTTTHFERKSEAITHARNMRRQGMTAKVYRSAGTYCQPGIGIAAYVNYYVETI